jgi:hypothetical protein
VLACYFNLGDPWRRSAAAPSVDERPVAARRSFGAVKSAGSRRKLLHNGTIASVGTAQRGEGTQKGISQGHPGRRVNRPIFEGVAVLKRIVVPFHTAGTTGHWAPHAIVINIGVGAKWSPRAARSVGMPLVSVDAQLTGFGFANFTRLGAVRRVLGVEPWVLAMSRVVRVQIGGTQPTLSAALAAGSLSWSAPRPFWIP